jgi:hypothetical protein
VNSRERAIFRRRWAALAGQRRREGGPAWATGDSGSHSGKTTGGRLTTGQRCPEVVRRQAKLADMRRQAILLARRMLDSMRPGQQLAEQQGNDEEEMTPATHGWVRLAVLDDRPNRPGRAGL